MDEKKKTWAEVWQERISGLIAGNEALSSLRGNRVFGIPPHPGEDLSGKEQV